MSPREANGRPRRRWEWLLLLLALLMSFSCVFCSTWWALGWPDRLTPANLLAQRQADYGRTSANEVEFAILDPLIAAQAATDVAQLQMTPTGSGGNSADGPFVIALLPATPTPTTQPEVLPLPQATTTPGNVVTPPTAASLPLPTINSTATIAPPATSTASSILPTATVPVQTPTLPAVPTSTPLSTNTPVVASPTPPPTATSVPPTLPVPSPTNAPTSKPDATAAPSATFTPTSAPTATATPTLTPTTTATATDTATPTATSLPAGFVLALCGTGISVDGNLNETTWSGPTTAVSKLVLGASAPVSANYRVRWDITYLYIGTDVVDNAIYADSVPDFYWEDDAVEVFFDINNNHSTTYQPDDLQFIVAWTDLTRYFMKNLTGTYYNNGVNGVQFGLSTTATGYSAEIAIPWAMLGTTPSGGNIYGFDLGVDGDQDGGNREAQLMWQGTANNWLDTSAFGQMVLANCVSSP